MPKKHSNKPKKIKCDLCWEKKICDENKKEIGRSCKHHLCKKCWQTYLVSTNRKIDSYQEISYIPCPFNGLACQEKLCVVPESLSITKKLENKKDAFRHFICHLQTALYMLLYTQKCPKCFSPGTLVEGCYSIQCPRCNTQFHYVCGHNNSYHHSCWKIKVSEWVFQFQSNWKLIFLALLIIVTNSILILSKDLYTLYPWSRWIGISISCFFTCIFIHSRIRTDIYKIFRYTYRDPEIYLDLILLFLEFCVSITCLEILFGIHKLLSLLLSDYIVIFIMIPIIYFKIPLINSIFRGINIID